MARWRDESPEEWAAYQELQVEIERRRGYPTAQRRRAESFGAFVEHVDKKAIHRAYEGFCGICLLPVELHRVTLDHIIPLSRGGLHCYENIQPAHHYCNRRKDSLLMEEMPDELRFASVPKQKSPYYNSRSYRQANTSGQRRAAA